jgi:hypothetical protein
MDLREYKVDPQLEEEGKEIQVDASTMMKIARFNNPAFRKMQERISEPYQKAVGRGNISDDSAGRILSRCMAKHIVKGWTGLTLDGVDIPYSEEKCLELFMDPTLKDFKEQVLLESQRIENYREERLEEDLKNSEEPSITVVDGTKKGKSSSKQ